MKENVNENEKEEEQMLDDRASEEEYYASQYQQEQKQEPLNETENMTYIEELSKERYNLMDIVDHRDRPTWTLGFMKERRLETMHRYKQEEEPSNVTYFPVTLQDDPDYKRYYRVTSKKLRRAIINRYLAKGKRQLEISRQGSGKNTVHRVRAVGDLKLLVIPTNETEFFEDVPEQQQRLSSQQQAAA